jgi:hypothetical protein
MARRVDDEAFGVMGGDVRLCRWSFWISPPPDISRCLPKMADMPLSATGVYSFRELRRELEQEEVHFDRGHRSCPSLVHWGREALCRFNGMFALGFMTL